VSVHEPITRGRCLQWECTCSVSVHKPVKRGGCGQRVREPVMRGMRNIDVGLMAVSQLGILSTLSRIMTLQIWGNLGASVNSADVKCR
jgi:hypothetical protein